jgi:hypothetical protein
MFGRIGVKAVGANKKQGKLFSPSRDRCYDFLYIFAEKFSKKMAFLTQIKLNYAKI